MLKIRLARLGKKKRPTYRFIVSESGRDTFGKALEIVGHYNPFSKVIEVNKERILHWISKGAKPSPTVHNILVDQNVIQSPKVKASRPGKKSAEAEKSEAAKPTEAKTEPTKEEAKPVEEAKPDEPKAETPEVKEKKENPKPEETPKPATENPTEEKKEEPK